MLERHIVIGGSSYTGSTLFSLILGALDGFENVGESNWLTPRLGEASDDPALFAHYDALPQCQLCGPSCKVWTRDFRVGLQRDPTGWYRRVADRLGTRNLVSSEKGPWNIRSLDPGLNNTTLVLFKSPFQHWASFVKRPERKKTLNATVTAWNKVYSTFLDDAGYAPKQGKVFLGIERFLSDPEANLPRLAKALDVPHDPSVLEYWKIRQHYMRGNFNIYTRIAQEPERLPVTNVVNPIRKADKAVIKEHEAFRTYQKLLNRSII